MSEATTREAGLDPRLGEIDRALREDDRIRERDRRAAQDSVDRIFSLPQLLRTLGATVLAASAFAFMLQNWASGSDVLRYFHFLGFTVVLAAGGFFCGLRIRDDKGARTFLGLAAAIVPVHFTVLGALLYSCFPWLSGFAHYPSYARFTAPDGGWALATAAIGVVTLLPIVWAAFLAFARPDARRLTIAYLASNALLLVPTRHPDLIGLLVLAALAGLVLFDRRALQDSAAMRTREGVLVRLMLAAPLAVLIGRSIHLYALSPLVLAGLLAALAVVLFELLPAKLADRERRRLCQRAATLPAAGAWWLVAGTLQANAHLPAGVLLPLTCLPIAGIWVALSLRAIGSGTGFRNLAALVATGGMTLNLLLHAGVGASLGCLATAIVVIAYGFTAERRGVFGIGLAALGFGLLYHLRFATELYAVSPWGSLALLGVATLVAASLIERHHRALGARLGALRTRVGGWSA